MGDQHDNAEYTEATEPTEPEGRHSPRHTVILSDLHLSEAEPPHPSNPLWKRYKRSKYFIDREFRALLEDLKTRCKGPIELVLNGDIFDFDSVMTLPADGSLPVSWLEEKRGLGATEKKSSFKMEVILRDHPIWMEALRDFILAGHQVVFVIGNHDVELHWRGVQKIILRDLNLPVALQGALRVCEWFYISERDTLVEHGNQYDAYSLCSNPIHPLVKRRGKVYVRLPFGNLANRYMMNGMGLFNPHADSTFIKESLWEYLVFFWRYMLRSHPHLVLTWLWGAAVTLFRTFEEGLYPSLRNPLKQEARIIEISQKANARPRTVRSLRALHVHPAYFSPMKIMRELWLDRAFFALGILFFSFWVVTTLNFFFPISAWWFFVVALGLTPFYIFYARRVKPEIFKLLFGGERKVALAAQIARVRRVVMGHTHVERHRLIKGVEYLNTGSWSPAYLDPECTRPYGRKCFAWIKPTDAGSGSARIAELWEWREGTAIRIPQESAPPTANS